MKLFEARSLDFFCRVNVQEFEIQGIGYRSFSIQTVPSTIMIGGLKKLSNSPLLRGELFECRKMDE
jgi:hypothetical protein